MTESNVIRPRIGAWITLEDPHVAEIASRIGFDFVVVDLQHGLIADEKTLHFCRAIELGAAKAVVRCKDASPAHIGRMLDYGADALIVPMIESAREVRELVSAARYAPSGHRSYGPTRVGIKHNDYYKGADKIAEIHPMIETKAALDDVEEIASVPGIAGLFVGPADLSLSLGKPPARDHEDSEFSAAILRILNACRNSGLAAGIQAERSLAEKRLRQGFSYLTVSLDSSDIKASFKESLELARSAARAD